MSQLFLIDNTYSGATFGGADKEYRYRLWRIWDPTQAPCMFVLLNPSTADEETNDPTVRRCMGYARSWGYGGLIVCNLFALRSTDPQALYDHPYPVGPSNRHHILECADEILANKGRLIVGWGTHGALRGQGPAMLEALSGHAPHALGCTVGKHPAHPLYLPAARQTKLWTELSGNR